MTVKINIQSVNSYHVERAITALEEENTNYVINDTLTAIVIACSVSDIIVTGHEHIFKMAMSGVFMTPTEEDHENLELKMLMNF